jgi:hypothetical protein
VFVVGHTEIHVKRCSLEQVNQWHIMGIIINNLKCQFILHHCNGLVEMIETVILLPTSEFV